MPPPRRGACISGRSLARVAVAVFGLLALLLAPQRVRAGDDDPGPGDFGTPGHQYKTLGAPPDAKGLFGYERLDAEGEGLPTVGAWVFVRRGEEPATLAYRVDVRVGEGGTAHLSVVSVTRDDETLSEPVQVGSGETEAGADRAAAARVLVRDADAAADAWTAAIAAKSPGAADALERDRLHWRAVARALEAARAKHPRHLGIQRDLVVAYSSLLPLVLGTPTASTLSMLVPRTLSEWTDGWGGYPTDDDARLSRRASASLFLLLGPPVLASQFVNEDPEDEELVRAKAVLDSLGYETVEPVEATPIAGAAMPFSLGGWRAAGEPKVPGVFFDRLTFEVRPESGPPLDIYYTLSALPPAQGDGAARWALYGVSSGSRRLLRLYGASEPDGALVKDFVREQVEHALRVEPAGSPR